MEYEEISLPIVPSGIINLPPMILFILVSTKQQYIHTELCQIYNCVPWVTLNCTHSRERLIYRSNSECVFCYIYKKVFETVYHFSLLLMHTVIDG